MTTTDSKGVSVHIGLNFVDPDHYQGWDGELEGCEFDAGDMAAIAGGRGFASKTILTKDATADAVTAAIADAAGQLHDGDLFLLSYSGHGGQVPDTNGEEPDKLDETWALFDRQLVDDELYALWARFEPGVRILVLSDSCHSGSAIRNVQGLLANLPPDLLASMVPSQPQVRMRAMPKGVARTVYEANRATYDGIQAEVPAGDTAEVGAHVFLISGCQDNQTSADGSRNGLFTQTLLSTWDEGRFKGGHRTFWRKIVEQMPPWQSPNWFAVGPRNVGFQRSMPFTITRGER